jgi:colicin import membrane protein
MYRGPFPQVKPRLKGFHMGKNSLIKSTDKKKKASKPVATANKKTAKKEAGNPVTTDTSEKAPQPGNAPVSAKAAPPPKKSLKELLFEKFDPITPQPAPQPVSPVKVQYPPAPPLIPSTDPAEADRMRKVLFARHSMEDIIAAAVQDRASVAVAPEPRSTIPAKKIPQDDSFETKRRPKPSPISEEVKPVVTAVDSGDGPDPISRSIKFAAAGFALLMILLIGASFKNSGNYYLNAKDDALEIWRGRFSPTGKAFFLALHDMQGPEVTKPVYAREEVFPIAFNYYLDKADALLETSAMPDYEGMRVYLNMARKYAINPVTQAAVMTRLNNIERMPLLYKADVAISRGTAESLQEALGSLRQAKRLTTDSAQAELVTQKIAAVEAQQAILAAEAAAEAQTQQ